MTGQQTPAVTSFRGGYDFLSNFHATPVELQGMTFPTAEHAYQAAKAAADFNAMMWILEAPTPGEAKRRGRKIPLQPGWDQARKIIMMSILLAKFTPQIVRRQLLATGQLTLIEGNHWGDTYWGAVGPDHPRFDMHRLPVWYAGPDSVLTGYNWLGQQLMWVREIVRDD